MVNVVARADPGRATGVSLASVARLMAYGYSSGEAEAALAAAGGDEAAAHAAAYAQLTGGWVSDAGVGRNRAVRFCPHALRAIAGVRHKSKESRSGLGLRLTASCTRVRG